MKRSSADYKKLARITLKGKYPLPMAGIVLFVLGISLCYMIAGAITGFTKNNAEDFNILSSVLYLLVVFVITLIASVVSAGLIHMILNLCRGKTVALSNMLYMFKEHPDRVILVSVLLELIAVVCMLPYFVFSLLIALSQGINWGYYVISLFFLLVGLVAYIAICLPVSLSIHLLVDDHELGAIDAMKKSISLMRGNNGRLLYMQLSFMGLILLSALSCYVGALWVMPYMQVTICLFYLDRIGELDTMPVAQKKQVVPVVVPPSTPAATPPVEPSASSSYAPAGETPTGPTVVPPTAPADEPPARPFDVPPSAPADESPAGPFDVPPSAPADEPPAGTFAESPSASADESPAGTFAESPSASADESPAGSFDVSPTAPVDESSSTEASAASSVASADESPAGPSSVPPYTAADESSAGPSAPVDAASAVTAAVSSVVPDVVPAEMSEKASEAEEKESPKPFEPSEHAEPSVSAEPPVSDELSASNKPPVSDVESAFPKADWNIRDEREDRDK